MSSSHPIVYGQCSKFLNFPLFSVLSELYLAVIGGKDSTRCKRGFVKKVGIFWRLGNNMVILRNMQEINFTEYSVFNFG